MPALTALCQNYLPDIVSARLHTLPACAYRYGHQDGVTGVDSLTRERAITSGGRDCSVRIWKVIEESQLVFHATSYVSRSLARSLVTPIRYVTLLHFPYFPTIKTCCM